MVQRLKHEMHQFRTLNFKERCSIHIAEIYRSNNYLLSNTISHSLSLKSCGKIIFK